MTGRVIRLTDESEGRFEKRMYSDKANAYVNGEHAYVFAGHEDGRPRFYDVHLTTGAVTPMAASVPYLGNTENWYWDATGRIYLPYGPSLHRVNPFTGDDLVVFTYEHQGTRLWQAHSADAGHVHSATVEGIADDGPYERLGTVVVSHGAQRYYAAQQPLDESQVDRAGEYLVIKEGDDNRIITLANGEERWIRDADGAAGHSDCGRGFMVGEDNIHEVCAYWDLRTLERRDLFSTRMGDISNMGHVSVRGGRCLLSDALRRELSLVDLESGARTPLLQHGVGGGYDQQVKANLDPSGTVATYMLADSVYLLVL